MTSLKIPHSIKVPVDAHDNWMKLLAQAQILVEDDKDLQEKSAKGLRLKERNLPPEVLGRMYSQYCCLINRMYDAYLNSVQLQRAPYMMEIISVFVKRLYELRNEIVHLIVNDYIYVDAGLIQNKLTPPEIEIVVPYHFPLECRQDGTEQLLQKMWADSFKRKNAPPKRVKPPKVSRSGMLRSETNVEPDDEESSEDEEIEPSEHTVITEEFKQASIIQAHERFRQWFMLDFKAKCNTRRTYFAEKVVPAPLELRTKAATLIQKTYREYMRLKRQRVRDNKRDILLGLIPDPWKVGLKFEEENNKVYERRRNTRRNLEEAFLKDLGKEKTRLLVFRKEDQIDDVTDHIREWFKEWYYGYGFFPEYPYELEGGTVMVIRGDFPSVEEKKEADEKYAAAMKGKTKEMIAQEKKQAKADALARAETLKDIAKKEAEQLFKLRCNPQSDPGYEVKTSEVMTSVMDALNKYRSAWSLYDRLPPEKYGEIVFGFMKELLTEDLMSQIHVEARKYVDELMRMDLKLLIKAQQAMFKNIGWKYPKMRARPKPKKPPVYKPLLVDQALLKNFEVLFDLGIISKSTTKLKDVFGDSNYAAYDLNIRDPNVSYPPPGYGDIRNRVVLSCIYGIGINPGAVKNKAVMLVGPRRNGKSFVVDAVVGELNAVKIDISPEVFSAIVDKPAKVMALVFQAARLFQPTIIFMRNVERVFAKKVPPEEKYLNAKSVKTALLKLLKNLSLDDKVMFIATCSDPFSAQAKPMVSTFDEVLLMPRTDYATLQMFFYNKLQAIRSMPRDYCVQALAQLLQGYGFGVVIEAWNKVMDAERIVRLNVKPFEPVEILEKLVEDRVEPTTMEDYQEYVNFVITNGNLKKEREEYDAINRIRDIMYTKIAKAKKEKKQE